MGVGVPTPHENMYSELINELTQRAAFFQQVQLPDQAIRELSQGRYDVVFVNAEVMIKLEYREVWQAVVKFMREDGGTAIGLGSFDSMYTRIPDSNSPGESSDLPNPFLIANLPWKFEEKHSCRIFQNNHYIPMPVARDANLPESYMTHSVFLADVDIIDAWYRTSSVDICLSPLFELQFLNPEVFPFVFPIAMAQVGSGKLGYVGEIGTGTPVSIMMAMAGFATV